jgi:transcriptional regulator with XRE-family HTH domain
MCFYGPLCWTVQHRKYAVIGFGERLRQERRRLGFTQTRFAAVAGASKNSQINWEKDVSSPTASALAAWGDAGADVQYILTGQRSSDSNEDGAKLDELSSLRQAAATLDQAEAALDAAQDWPILSTAPEIQLLREALVKIAQRTELPQPVRARADWILSFAFGDTEARERYRRRSRRAGLSLKLSIRELEEVEAEYGWQPPRAMHHALMALHFKHGLDREDIRDLLAACKASLEERLTA